MVIQSGLHLAHVLAEAQHHAELVRLDPEEAGETPQRDGREAEQREALAAEIAARQHAAQFVLAAAEDFLQIRRRRAPGDCGPEPQGPLPPEPHGPPPPPP